MGVKVKKPQLPEWADPAQQSVMSPEWKNVVRRVASVLGLDAPPDVATLDPVATAIGGPLKQLIGDELMDYTIMPASEGVIRLRQILKEALPPFRQGHISPEGKNFYEQGYKTTVPVRAVWDDDMSTLDSIKGLNPGHALYRAEGNWGADGLERIQLLGDALKHATVDIPEDLYTKPIKAAVTPPRLRKPDGR